jgi:hypothetical protein
MNPASQPMPARHSIFGLASITKFLASRAHGLTRVISGTSFTE